MHSRLSASSRGHTLRAKQATCHVWTTHPALRRAPALPGRTHRRLGSVPHCLKWSRLAGHRSDTSSAGIFYTTRTSVHLQIPVPLCMCSNANRQSQQTKSVDYVNNKHYTDNSSRRHRGGHTHCIDSFTHVSQDSARRVAHGGEHPTLAVQRSTTEHPSARGALPTHEGT